MPLWHHGDQEREHSHTSLRESIMELRRIRKLKRGCFQHFGKIYLPRYLAGFAI